MQLEEGDRAGHFAFSERPLALVGWARWLDDNRPLQLYARWRRARAGLEGLSEEL